MSEVLVRQLQQVLSPWDSLIKDNDAASSGAMPKSTLDSWGIASSQDALAHARAATTKLELARAALALFTSNAGSFRSVLVKLFRFLFDHVDELRDEVARSTMEKLLWQEGETVRVAAAARLSAEANELGVTPAEQSAVVAAYEKVRLTESRMAALVEEASVQRDHFKSQMEAQRKQQYHLEDLLRHQMELTETLLDHRLRQELVGGGASAAQSSRAGEGAASTATPASFGSPFSVRKGDEGDGNARRYEVSQFDVASPATSTEQKCSLVDRDVSEKARHPAERRDAAYVQRLIERANREFVLEKTEDQMRELRAQHDELENKVQSLLKLNTKYARQCVELSARLSIIHEHNIALAADVHLFQRDCLAEQQRSANLQHALLVARGIVLITLQVQPSYQADDMLEQLEMIDKLRGDSKWTQFGDGSSSPTQSSRGQTSIAASSHTLVRQGDTECFAPSTLQLDSVDQINEALRAVPAPDLRSQLQDVLQVDDVESGGKIKAALLRLLELEAKVMTDLHYGVSAPVAAAATAAKTGEGWLSPPCARSWAPPYGLRPSVPRHLRSATTVPLLFLHPVLAETFVHELITQRQQLLAFAQLQFERAKSLASKSAGKKNGRGASTTALELQQVCAAASSTFMPFHDFIEFFMLVVWLNRADQYLPLLPLAVKKRLEEEAQARAEARERRASRRIAAGITSGGDKGTGGNPPNAVSKALIVHTSLWELRQVLHLVRPSTESKYLPLEGLQLTYALDMASKQVNAGPLTYAYGLVSRGTLCEVLFYIMRAERETLLGLCRIVDAAMTAHAREVRSIAEAEKDNSASFSTRLTAKAKRPQDAKDVNGWIPTVQFIRVLLVMYPGYPVGKLEQLIDAAVSDGTVGTESPATLFYEVLLPGRMLPGPTTAATTADTSVAIGTRFASIFYAAICDDALSSMQLIEDSVDDFARDLQQGGAEAAGYGSPGAAAGDTLCGGGDGMASATARSITAHAFLCLPRLEGQQWAAGLRSAINRWPRLRSTIADPSKSPMENSQKTAELTEADQVSTVARVPVGEVMPYLRRNVVVRRGLFTNSETAAAATSPVGLPTSEVKAAPTADRSTARKISPSGAAGPKGEPAKGSPTSHLHSAIQLEGWTPTEATLLQQWEAQWARYSVLPPDSSSGAAGVGPSCSLGGPSQVSEYVELLRQVDPYRTRPWGSELVSRDNAVLYPLDFTRDLPAEALDDIRRDSVAAPADVALKQETAKTVKRGTKKASTAR